MLNEASACRRGSRSSRAPAPRRMDSSYRPSRCARAACESKSGVEAADPGAGKKAPSNSRVVAAAGRTGKRPVRARRRRVPPNKQNGSTTRAVASGHWKRSAAVVTVFFSDSLRSSVASVSSTVAATGVPASMGRARPPVASANARSEVMSRLLNTGRPAASRMNPPSAFGSGSNDPASVPMAKARTTMRFFLARSTTSFHSPSRSSPSVKRTRARRRLGASLKASAAASMAGARLVPATGRMEVSSPTMVSRMASWSVVSGATG